MTEIRIPADLWGDGDEAAISAWLYADGEPVRQGSIVAEIMVEKSSYELTAPADGILHILTTAELPVAKGQVVGRIG